MASRRNSERVAVRRSLGEGANYTYKHFMENFKSAVEGSQNTSTKATAEAVNWSTAGSGRAKAKAGRQKAQKSKAPGSGTTARAIAARASASRVTGANGRVTKPVKAPVRKASPKAAPSTPLRNPRIRPTSATSLQTPPSDTAVDISSTLQIAMGWNRESSRESSPLSDVPDSFMDGEAALIEQRMTQSSPMEEVVAPLKEVAAPQDDAALSQNLASASQQEQADENATAALNDDVIAMEDVPTAEAVLDRDETSGNSPAVSEGENIDVSPIRSSGLNPATDPRSPESASPISPSELPNEQAAPTPFSSFVQKYRHLGSSQPAADDGVAQEGQPSDRVRRRAAVTRYGQDAKSTTDVKGASPQTSGAIAEDEDDLDYEQSPKKKRRTSTSAKKALKTPTKRPQVSKTGSTTKRPVGRPRKSAVNTKSRSADAGKMIIKLSVPTSKLLMLTQPVSSEPLAAFQDPMPKPARKRNSNSTPKTPTARALPPTPESVAAVPAQPEIAVDPQKLALSRKLTTREPLGMKPQAQGQPLVWAESRQALCETLPYFKRPQGGCYQNDSHVYGFLFDSVGHCREYLDEDVIICRAGGSMELDPSGGLVQKKDQSMKEAQVQAILNDIAHQNPLIVICGNRNGGAKCEMPHQYSVLGWYKPVAVWEERTAGKGKEIWTTIKYRLERFNQAGEPVPWHAPAASDLASLKSSASLVHQQHCTECGKLFDQVYLQDWMCLNSACEQFWKINGLDAPCGNAGLDYNPDFLLTRAPAWGDETSPPAPLRPPIPDVGNIIGDDLAYINTRGICCPKCGRCNSRRLFDRWVCENPTCDYELRPQHRPVLPTHLHTPWDVAPTLVRNKVEPGVHLKVEHKFGYKVCTYTFDGIDGCFIHAAATKPILSAPNGPDEMMANLQSEDLGLERRVFGTTKMSGGKKVEDAKPVEADLDTGRSPPTEQPFTEQASRDTASVKEKRIFEEGDLMTAFSMNYGMPYKFVASGASRSFTSAPKAVNDCRYRLNWAARALLGKDKDALDFNEELIFTYLEGQKIEYHDDGEDGLGPEIASLSLGGRAKMYMRMKAKHYVGCSKTGILTEERPVPGSIDGAEMYQKRLAAWNELQMLRTTDTAAYNKRRKELPRELGLFEKRMKKADDLVTVTLSHGDIMVMDGYAIQRYLEHKVVPEGYLRFALTCRTVLEGHLREGERPGYVVEPDVGGYDGGVGWV